MTQNWGIPQDGADRVRQIEKRLARLERQSGGGTSSLLGVIGPGIAAQAVQIMDWNARDATLNGFFHSSPGAINSPDPILSWTGQVISKDDGTGMQQVWNTDGPETLYWMRTYIPTPTADGNVVFSQWKRFATPSGLIGTGELSQDVLDAIETGATPTAPPADSPTIIATGFADSILLTAEPLDAPTTQVEYHASTVAGFTPDSTTLLAGSPTRSTIFTVARMPDTSLLEPEVTYYFRAVATNVVGNAAPGPEASANLDPEAVSTLFAALLKAGDIEAGRLNIGPGYWDPDEGIVIPQNDGSITRISTLPDVPSTWAGQVIATFLTVLRGMVSGLLEVLGVIRLQAGVTAPESEPVLTYEWDKFDLNSSGGWGLCDSFDGTEWCYVNRSNDEIRCHSKTTGAVTRTISLGSFPKLWNMTRVGQHFYVLYTASGVSGTVIYNVYKVDMTGTIVDSASTGVYTADVANGHPVLSPDATAPGLLVMAYPRSSGTAHIRIVKLRTGEFDLGDLHSSKDVFMSNRDALGGVAAGQFDLGSDMYALAKQTGSSDVGFVEFINNTVGTDDAFNRAYGGTIQGLWWDASTNRFITMNQSGRLHLYSDIKDNVDLTYAYAWASEDGTKETQISPEVVAANPARAFVRLSMPPPPESNLTGATRANRIALYGYRSGFPNTLQTILPVGESDLRLTTLTTTGKVPETVNGFAAVAAPGRFESTGVHPVTLEPLICLDGSGAWKMGDMSGAVDGTITTRTIFGSYVSDTTPTVADSTWTARSGWSFQGNSSAYEAGFSYGGGVFTCQVPGVYTITATFGFATNNTGRRQFRIQRNGALGVSTIAYQTVNAVGGGATAADITGIGYFAVGDSYTVEGWQNSGGGLTWSSSNDRLQHIRTPGS